MILALFFSFHAFAADESSFTIKSAKFCFMKPLARSSSQWLGSACKGGALLSISSDRTSIQVIADNAKHMPRSFQFARSSTEFQVGEKVTLSGPEFIATCGRPLVLEVVSGSPAQFQVSSGDGATLNPSSIEMKKASKKMAEDMKDVLLQKISTDLQAYSNNEIKACYSGLQSTLKNFQLDGVLSADEKKRLDGAIYPTKGVSPSNGTADR